MQRLIHHYDILACRAGPGSGATPSDFELAWTASSDRFSPPGTALAYCADFAAERVLFSLHDNAALAGLFSAPFLFPEQARQASGLVSVPFEQLAACGQPGQALQPCFVFSPGRTGSTLLARLLDAAGLPSVSEPDMLEQVVWMGEENRRKLPADCETRLAGTCVAALGRARGNGLFIKLRSQCNERPLAITRSSPGCRAVFMLRRVIPWALSRHRAFQESPASVAAVLRQAMDALHVLSAAGVPLGIMWFETLTANPLAALRLCAPLAEMGSASLARIMALDSQRGTRIARDVVGASPVHPGFVAGFTKAWAAARADTSWNGQTEDVLAQMWVP